MQTNDDGICVIGINDMALGHLLFFVGYLDVDLDHRNEIVVTMISREKRMTPKIVIRISLGRVVDGLMREPP